MAHANSSNQAPELPARYYRDNFVSLCNAVEAQYIDLLNEDERLFLQQFRNLSTAAQCLYVRLASRVGPWFRVSKLAYSEIGNLEPVIDELIEQDLVFSPIELATDEMRSLFTKPELMQAFGDTLPAHSKMAKDELLDCIAQCEPNGECRLERLIERFGECIIAVDGIASVEVFQVLFFGNRHQGMTDFVLSDLGIARYFPYALTPEHRLFPERAALDDYLSCGETEYLFYQFMELEDEQGMLDIADFIIGRDMSSSAAYARWQKLCNRLGREFERMGHLSVASTLYLFSDIHPSRERNARILEARADWSAVVVACEEMLANPRCESEREAAEKIILRAQRKLGLTIKRRPADCFEQLTLTVARSDKGVELDTAEQLCHQWSRVYYVENRLFNSLFGLAFWEEIFADVAGAFDNPFQSAPRDMYTPAFVANREAQLAAKWRLLKRGNLSEMLLGSYHRYQGYQCRWVDWYTLDEQLLHRALQVIPREHLFAIWERLLFDPGENRNGFPDLIALGDGMGDYCLVEVKGPGDALQNNQKRWLRYFQGAQIPAAVAWVEWAV